MTLAQADRPAEVTFDLLYYHGWHAWVDDRPVPLKPLPPLGLVAVSIPAGEHRLELAYVGDWSDHLGLFISLLAVLFVVGQFCRPNRDGWPVRLAVFLLAIVLVTLCIKSQIAPTEPLRGGINFGRLVRLVGSRVDYPTGARDDVVAVTLLWEALETPLPSCTVHLMLVDDSGHIAARRDKSPLFGLRDCSLWKPGQLVRDHQEIRLQPGFPKGQYFLVLALELGGDMASAISPTSIPRGSGSAATAMAPALDSQSQVVLGRIGAKPPAIQVPSELRPLNLAVGAYFALIGANVTPTTVNTQLSSPQDSRFVARVSPGEDISIELGWRAVADAPEDYVVFTHLLDLRSRLVAQHDSWPDSGNAPTSTWIPGDVVLDHHSIHLPPTLSPGVYSVAVGMYSPDTKNRLPIRSAEARRDYVTLGNVKVSNPGHVYGQPVTLDPVSLTFGRQLALVGSRLERRSYHPGDRVTVNLAWRAIASPSTNYTVFIHILNGEGRLVAQYDGQPLAGLYPTGYWDVGDTVFDRLTVSLPPELPDGRYSVHVGIYHLDSGIRLPTAGGETEPVLGTIDVS